MNHLRIYAAAVTQDSPETLRRPAGPLRSAPVIYRFIFALALSLLLTSCAQKDRIHTIRVSVADQKLAVYKKGVHLATYDVSTSKWGVGDEPGSRRTPLGRMEIAKKIGGGAPLGMKFKSRRPTGEIVPIDAPGRDPIVTRILWLRGLEDQNRRAFSRMIYIHGTAEERNIGKPVSYGCVRMRSRDVIALYDTVGVGAQVEITTAPLDTHLAHLQSTLPETR
jgi:lipoprotein-anchoring transpeptidase ErfK/SrfK